MTQPGVDKLSLGRLQAAIDQAPGRLFRNLRGALRDSGADWEGKMQRRVRGGSPLRRRTGALARSLRQDTRGSSLRNLEMRAATTSPYAKVQEFGTSGAGGQLPDIRPKNGKALTVPLSDNLTSAGVPRYPSAAALRATGETFLLKTKSGKAFIVKREGETLRWLWILKDRVAIPPRLGFFATWRQLRDRRRRRLRQAVSDTLTGRGGS